MAINKEGEFPIIGQLDLDVSDFGVSGVLPALSEPRYDLVGAGKTFMSYGSLNPADDIEQIPYKPIPGELGYCDFAPDFKYSVGLGSGDGILGMFYKGMTTATGLAVDDNFHSEPTLGMQSTGLIIFVEDETYNTVRNNPFRPNVGYKVEVIGTYDDLPYSYDLNNVQCAPDSCTVLNTVETDVTFEGGEDVNVGGQIIPFYPDPEIGLGIAALRGIQCKFNTRRPHPEYQDTYIFEEKIITVNILFHAKINILSIKHSLISSSINHDLSVTTNKFGTYNGLYGDNEYPVTQIIKQRGNTVEFATQISQTAGSPGLYYKIENGELIERIYFQATTRNDLDAFKLIVADKFGMYPYSSGSSIYGNKLYITRQSLEAVDPAININSLTQTEVFNLNITSPDYSPVFSCSDGPYTVIAGAEIDNKQQLIFALRDGTGCYTCDISEYLLNKQLNNFGYQNGIIYLGLIDENSEINYTVLIPDLPVARFEKVTYEFKKLNISFIPCQTHCLAKGGIVSKIY